MAAPSTPPFPPPPPHHVQHHIGHTGTHRDPKAQGGLFRRNEKALEHILQNKGGQTHQQDPAIPQGVVQHFPSGPQQHRHRTKDHQTQHRQGSTGHQSRRQEQAEVGIRLFPVLLSQSNAHNGRTAGAQHEAHGADEHGQGHNEIHRRKGCFAHKIRHTQAVHNAVNGCEQHGSDAGQHEPQQPGTGKMIR